MILKYLVNRPLRTAYLPSAREFTWLAYVQVSYLRSDVTYGTWYLLKLILIFTFGGGEGGDMPKQNLGNALMAEQKVNYFYYHPSS